MRILLILLAFVLAVVSFSVEAGVRFETYNVADMGWIDDTACISGDYIDSIDLSDAWYDLAVGGLTISAGSGSVVSSRLLDHDTLREYIVGLDTIIILHRIECDTSFTKFFVENDSTFVQIKGITCDTIFRVEYRDVWAPKRPVWIDSLDWQALMRIIQKERE